MRQRFDKWHGQHHTAVTLAFAVAHDNLLIIEIGVVA